MDNKNKPKKRMGRPKKPENMKPKRPVGRPKTPDRLKTVYQRVPIRVDTYLKLKKKSILENKTMTEIIDEQFKW